MRAEAAPLRGALESSVVQYCGPLQRRSDLPDLPRWMARGPDRVGGRRLPEPLSGFGIALDDDVARTSAVAEVVERWAALAPVPAEQLVRAAYSSLRGGALAPSCFPLYSSRQLRGQERVTALTDDGPIDWRPARSLTRRRDLLVPAALVHLSLVRRPPNTYMAEATATGTACHTSVPDATLAALCEVLERDAVMAAWLARVSACEVQPDTTTAAIIEGPLRNCEATFRIYRVPSDSPFPVMLAVAWSDGHPRAAVGAACHPDRQRASTRAVLEAAQVLSWLRSRPPRLPEQVRTFADHADLYATPEGSATLAGFCAGGDESTADAAGIPDTDTTPSRLAMDAVRHLADEHHEVVVVDLTTPEIAADGFHVVRVLVTGMIDINADVRWPRLGGNRARGTRARLTLANGLVREERMNRHPVPLA